MSPGHAAAPGRAAEGGTVQRVVGGTEASVPTPSDMDRVLGAGIRRVGRRMDTAGRDLLVGDLDRAESLELVAAAVGDLVRLIGDDPSPCTRRCQSLGLDDIDWYAKQYGVCPCWVRSGRESS